MLLDLLTVSTHLIILQVRKRSKACRAGLREGDELVSINDNSCGSLSHAQAMNLIDSMPGLLHIRVKRYIIPYFHNTKVIGVFDKMGAKSLIK